MLCSTHLTVALQTRYMICLTFQRHTHQIWKESEVTQYSTRLAEMMGGIPSISAGVAGIDNLVLSIHQKTAFEYSKDTLQ